jgi:hypothetical protein
LRSITTLFEIGWSGSYFIFVSLEQMINLWMALLKHCHMDGFIGTDDQLVDGFTKALPHGRFCRSRHNLNLM